MTIDPLELKEISDDDLASLFAFCRYSATDGKNRFFLDLFGIIERESQ